MSPETRDARVLKSKNASSYHLDASSMHLNTTEKEKLFKASMNENSLFVLERMPRLLPGFSATIMKTNENGATRLCLTLKQQSYQMYSQVRHSRGSRKRRCFHTKAKFKAESCWEQRGDSAVKSTQCSFWRPEFSSQHPCGATCADWDSSSQWSHSLLLTLNDTSAHTHMRKPPCRQYTYE